MHSNFITPPDYVESVLILNTTDEQVAELGVAIKSCDRPYNVYFYNDTMDNHDWLDLVKARADVILDAKLINPLEHFNK